MVAAATPDLSAFLARTALDRARAVAPFVFLGVCSALLLSGPNDIEVTPVILGFNVFVLACLAALVAMLWTRRLPLRFGHAAAAVMWWGPVANTLVSYAGTHNHLLVLVFLLEMSAVMLLVSTWSIAVSLVLVNVVWVTLRVAAGGPDTTGEIETALLAQIFGVVGHLAIRRHLVGAELHRLAEVATATALAEQLAEHERLQEQLLHAQRMEAVGTLAAGIAHDMNNVLASIMGMAEGLRDDATDAATRDDLEQIRREAERGAELTHGLLAFSRRGKYRKQVMRAARVIDDVVPILARTLAKTIHIRDSNDARRRVHRGRHDPARPGRDQPRPQRGRRDGRQGHARDRRRHRVAWRRRRAARAIPRELRAAARDRHRHRHPRRRAQAHLRAVLHDQAARQGHRPRPVDRVWLVAKTTAAPSPSSPSSARQHVRAVPAGGRRLRRSPSGAAPRAPARCARAGPCS